LRVVRIWSRRWKSNALSASAKAAVAFSTTAMLWGPAPISSPRAA
jgi:hypothetical protein